MFPPWEFESDDLAARSLLDRAINSVTLRAPENMIELEGAALDAAVAKAAGYPLDADGSRLDERTNGGAPTPFHPSTDWRDGGPLIERERIELWPAEKNWTAYIAVKPHRNIRQYGPTPLIAAMRAYVASRT